MLIGGSVHKVKPARTISAEPTTERMSIKPMPGQPPANVEYKRRNRAPFWTLLVCDTSEADRNPKKSRERHSLEFGWQAGEQGTGGVLQFDDSSLQADHRGMRSVAGAQFRKDALDSALHGFLRDGELIRDFLVRIPGRNQS